MSGEAQFVLIHLGDEEDNVVSIHRDQRSTDPPDAQTRKLGQRRRKRWAGVSASGPAVRRRNPNISQ